MRKLIRRYHQFSYRHPQIAVLLTFFCINLVILFIYSGIIAVVEKDPYSETFAYVLTMCLMPDKLFDISNQDNGMWDNSHFWQLSLMIIETVIFSGTIIGFVTNVLDGIFEKKTKAKGKLDFVNHMLLLNWSSLAPSIIYDLSFSDEKYDIIILSPIDRDEIINSIDSIFIENKRKRTNLNITVKQGNPISSKDLDDCSIDLASSIAILLPDKTETTDDFVEDDMTDRDISSLKLLMCVASLITNKTNIVVEVDTRTTVTKIDSLIKNADNLKDKKISIFSYNSVLGHIMGSILINQKYSDILNEVLSFEGNEFYSIPNGTMEETLKYHNNCIPFVEYDDDKNGTIDQVYILAGDKKDFFDKKYIRKEPYTKEPTLTFIESEKRDSFTLVIVGDNRKARAIEDEMVNYNNNSKRGIVVKVIPNTTSFDTILKQFENCKGIKKLLLLSNEASDEDSVDANIFISLLNLKAHRELAKDIEIYTEILDPKNQLSTSNFDVTDVVISNKFISLLLIQLLTHPDGKAFYEDLVTSNTGDNLGTFDLDIREAKDAIKITEPLVYHSKAELVNDFFYSSKGSKSLVGIIKPNSKSIMYLCNNIDVKEDIIIEKNTELVYIVIEQ